ncbi:tetratricopeptide repeat protein [Clostridium swellfunianum]|uniref:tetratricopeptide repeat protein n=1 Tax=Clostridium swellfunianum TaxID=1367462 RepID=UPI002030DD04|nr:tetratricopeptide repeat protein [Clostridium swellfunianum]MCM0649492.1 tetratricopeptide repeat protein [Clostridium swellfunianum]
MKNLLTAIIVIVLVTTIFKINILAGLLIVAGALFFFIYKNRPIIYMIRANKNYSDGNIKEAMILYEKSYKLKENNPKAAINYSYMLLKQGELDKAQNVLENIMKTTLNVGDRSNVVINLSLVLWKNGNLDEAVKALEELYGNGYKNTLVYQNLGFFYILSGDLEKALQFNTEAYEYNSSDASILDNLAMTYYHMTDYDKAIESFEKLMSMNPAFVTAYYYYGLTLDKKGKPVEALEAIKKALECNFSFLTSIKREDVENEIERLEKLIK